MADPRLTRLRAAVALALPLLEEQRRTIVECHSNLRAGPDGEPEPVPGTLEPIAEPHVAELDTAIAQCDAALSTGEQDEPSPEAADSPFAALKDLWNRANTNERFAFAAWVRELDRAN